MPESADVVVLGGGIIGCSTALHLVEADVGDVLLLERDCVAQGTSSAGAGFLGCWAAGFTAAWGSDELELERYGLDFYRGLDADGHDIGLKNNGNLWAATTEETWHRHLERLEVDASVEDKRILDPHEVGDVTGIIPSSAVVGGILHPSGAQITAPKAVDAVAHRLRERGGRIDERRPVERLLVDRGRVTGVSTARGDIRTSKVVLAAGAWTNELLATAGAYVPMVPLVAARIVTEPLGVPSTMPTLMLPEYAFIWLREERGGLLFGCSFEADPRYSLVGRGIPGRFDAFPLDGVEETRGCAARASATIPILSRYRSATVAHGAPCYTPDLRAMVGPVPAIDGLYVVGGCNEAGITHGPGYGRLLTQLIAGCTSTSSVDAASYRLDRFGASMANDDAVVEAMKSLASVSWVQVSET